MAGRFEEAVGSGLPDRRQATPQELFDYWDAGFHARDWGALRDLLSPQLQGLDRCPIGWGSLDGPDAYLRYVEELVALAPDVRMSMTPLVWGRRAAVVRVTQRGHLAAGGREMELGYAVLFLVADGRMTRFEYFEPVDYQQAVVRFEEIGAQTEPERLRAQICRLMNARDYEGVATCYAESHELVDRRALGWETLRGGGAVIELHRTWVEIVPDVEVWFETLASDKCHIATRMGARGHAADDAGGGSMQYDFTLVGTARDGQMVYEELFADVDEVEALARYDELRDDRQ